MKHAATIMGVCLALTFAANAQPKVEVLGESVIDANAIFLPDGQWGQTLNGRAFQQEAMVSHGAWQYATYFDADRRVCLARRKSGESRWEVIRFEDHRFKGRDTHNAPVVGICRNDGTIHLSFDHHGHPLRYRVSEKGLATHPEQFEWTAERFGPIRDWLEEGKPLKGVTYPRFFATPDGNMQMAYRIGGSGNGDTHLADYDGASSTWRNGGPIIGQRGTYASSKSRCAYENGFTYGPAGKLHVTWCWREPGGPSTNHDVNYIFSDDAGRTWHDNAGNRIGRRGEQLVTIDTPGIRVVDIPMRRGLINSVSQAVDPAARVHVMTFHLPDGTASPAKWTEQRATSRYQHYFRDVDGTWHRRELPFGGGTRAQMFVDADGNSATVLALGDKLCIAAARAAQRWSDWQIIYEGDRALVGEPRFDPKRWEADGILSVFAQDMPTNADASGSPLRAIEFKLRWK